MFKVNKKQRILKNALGKSIRLTIWEMQFVNLLKDKKEMAKKGYTKKELMRIQGIKYDRSFTDRVYRFKKKLIVNGFAGYIPFARQKDMYVWIY